MHIFLTNDDGIDSKGLKALARHAVCRGHRVSLCAPASPQSAASQKISLIDPIFIAPRSFENENITAYAIQGTPTDCVRLGLFDLVEKPVDVLISGINNGYNAGMAVYYSGTVGAAREGALNGLPSIAASIHYEADTEMLEHFASYVLNIAEKYPSLEVPPRTVLNINAPLQKPEELLPPVLVPLSTANYLDTYIRRDSPRSGIYYWLEGGARTEPFSSGSDQALLEQGHITLTLMGIPEDLSAYGESLLNG